MKEKIQQSESGITQINSQNSALSANLSVDDMSTSCDCGCGNTIGSLEFIRLHVESQEEQEQRLASEQYHAEQESQKMYYDSLPEPHSMVCGCVECN